MGKMKITWRAGEAEVTEKKSRFLAQALPVHSEEEALEYLAKRRKQYWDARHNCWAYVIGSNPPLQRCSDDGEPQGTAGRPILDVLLGAEVHDTLVVVTRYFGGVLLGTGGLVRAYGKAASDALSAATVICRQSGFVLTLETDYTGLGKIQFILASKGMRTLNESFTDTVTLEVLVPEEQIGELRSVLTEATSGRVRFLKQTETEFALDKNEPILF